ncbi:MAG: cation transporter [Ruminococcaceae bacterium]|nr:cation transporter [Oscillospiraceae bacterium]
MTKLLLKLFIRNRNPQESGTRAAIGKLSGAVGIFCNLLLATAKLVVGILAGAVSVAADAMNNFSDAASSIVTLIGFKLAEKPADSEHPYGHARFEYLSGLAVAALIIVIGFELVKTSLDKILHPSAVVVSVPLIVVLAASMAVKLWMCLFNRKLGKLIDSTALLAVSADSRNDVIATGAVLLATVVEQLTHLAVDGYMGMAVALFILYSGAYLAKQTISPLLGEAASPELRQKIVRVLDGNDRVLGWHDLMVHDYGPGQRFASIHVEMDQKEDPLVCHEIIDDMERLCFEKHQVHLVIHYDPVVTDDPEIQAVKKEIESILTGLDSRLTLHDFRMVRGTGHSNLIFDVALPHDMAGQKASIQQTINDTLQKEDGGVYHTVITFDLVD